MIFLPTVYLREDIGWNLGKAIRLKDLKEQPKTDTIIRPVAEARALLKHLKREDLWEPIEVLT